MGLALAKTDSMELANPATGQTSRTHDGKSAATSTDGVSPEPPGDPLAASVLVLNRLYMAVHVIGVRRAFILLYGDLAEVIHLEDGRFANYDFQSWREIGELRCESKSPLDDWIRTVHFEIQVPRVIRLLRYDRMPRQDVHLNRRNILARDEHRCQYCARHLPAHLLSIDHVIPRSRGGGTSWENLVCACLACNIRKGGRTPHEAKMKLVRRPVKPQRSPLLLAKLRSPRYSGWRTWVDGAHGDSGGRE